MDSKQSWKQKVSPALADQIRTFVESLTFIKEPDKEHLEEFIEAIKDASIKSFKPFYEENGQFKQLVNLAKFMSNQNWSDMTSNSRAQEKLVDEIANRITPDMLIYLSFQFLNFTCIFLEKKPLMALYKEAREGKNKKSLFKLLRYDKTLFDHEWFRELIFREALVGNSIFFEQLGDAVKSKPLIDKHEQRKLKYVLLLFWPAVFSKLTYNEQMELLDYVGLEVPSSYDTYKKLIQRKIRPLFKKNQ